MLALLLAAVFPCVAPASAVEDAAIARAQWRVLGWNDACSAALEVEYFPKLGQGLQAEPVETNIGTMTIPPGREDSKTDWNLQLDGAFSWDPKVAAQTEKDLGEAGWSRPGYAETVPENPAPETAPVLLSTSSLRSRLTRGWPGPGWRLAAVNFNPLSTCAVVVYARSSKGPRLRFLLTRVYDPDARRERARAHAEDARLLFEDGQTDAASAEAQTAADLAPDLPIARYENAAVMTLTGRIAPAMAELAAAIRLDASLRARARDDDDFEALRVRGDFQVLVGGKPGSGPSDP